MNEVEGVVVVGRGEYLIKPGRGCVGNTFCRTQEPIAKACLSLSLSVSLHVCDCSLNHCVTIAPFIQQRLAHDRHVGPNVELHEWLKILKSQACILLQVCANRGYQTPLDSIVSVLSRFCLSNCCLCADALEWIVYYPSFECAYG